MIITEQTTQIERHGQVVEGEFTIETTAKSFKMLISNIYSNIEKAVCQELTANAFDSHVLAGKPTEQFEVHLPNCFESFFSVRDFGISMSHEFMMTKYTRAFYSDKSSTNEALGCLGLGRLSALTLSSNYVAECFLDGKKRSYSVFLNERGVPAIMFLGEIESSEPQGFRVEVSIPENKISVFNQNAVDVLRFYKVKPIITGNKITIPEFRPLIQGNGWQINNDWRSGIYAIMGCYAYPIDKYIIQSKLSENARKLLEGNIIVEFGIGKLNVNAGREGLYYCDTTIANIVERFEQVAAEFKDIIVQKFQNCKTAFEVRKTYYELKKNQESLCNLVKLEELEVWNGKSIKKLTYFSRQNFAGVDFECVAFKGKTKLERSSLSYIPYNSKILYVLVDEEVPRISNRFRTINAKNPEKEIIFVKFFNQEAADKFNSEYNFDSYPCLNISDFEDTKIARKIGQRNTLVCGVYSYNPTNYSWSLEQKDIYTLDGLYVYFRGNTDRICYQPAKKSEYIENIYNLVKFFTDNGIKVPQIYGVKSSQVFEKIKKNPSLSNFFDFAIKHLMDLAAKNNVVSNEYDCRYHYNKLNEIGVTKDNSPKDLADFMIANQPSSLSIAISSHIKEIDKFFGHKHLNSLPRRNAPEEYSKLIEKYSILDLVINNCYSPHYHKKKIEKYLKLFC